MNLKSLLSAITILIGGKAVAGSMDDKLAAMDFTDISTIEGVKVELMYARPYNFTGKVLYTDLERAWLHPAAAKALAKAAEALKRDAPGLRLLVKDAARPMSVQRRMFQAVTGTSKARYVANPAKGGGLHNYGLAVDITLVDAEGRELPMGTPVDHLGKEAHIDTEESMVAAGIITREELKNRRLLRKVMTEGGFKTIRNEWWHFQMKNRAAAQRENKRINF